MYRHSRTLSFFLGTLACVVASNCRPCVAQQQRARPPVYEDGAMSRIFFPDLSTAFRGERPTLSSLRKIDAVAAMAQSESTEGNNEDGVEQRWNRLVSPISLEDEIKRVKLQFDAVITSPGAFNSGGYQDARLHLSVLASLFAVISEYSGDVRWKSDAKTARDLTAKTALNCAAGSTPVFNEAQLRKADLQDLISGTGLSAPNAGKGDNDWSLIVDRSPMMQYVELLLDRLSEESNDEATAKDHVDSVRRNAELIALVGEIIIQEGMAESDDDDYVAMSRAMTKAARSVVTAIDRQDFAGVRRSVGAITQSCADCHEQYR